MPADCTAEHPDSIGRAVPCADIRVMDADGWVRIHDRLKDLVNRGGYKVPSVEVENTICHMPEVAECAVVAHPDPVLGEKVHAFIWTNGAVLDAERVKAFCAARLAEYKVPDYVTFEPAEQPFSGGLVWRYPGGSRRRRHLVRRTLLGALVAAATGRQGLRPATLESRAFRRARQNRPSVLQGLDSRSQAGHGTLRRRRVADVAHDLQ
jgi:acyl-CoA synthetase (AMP-forming)/AMP-acid ligase II